jgi:hypothetical protein
MVGTAGNVVKRDRQCTYNVTFRSVRVTIFAVENQEMCVCVLALVIQHAKRMRHIILSSVACLTLTIFFHIIS